MSWPHQDDGTVDWETVFEDEDVGLITFIERAKTTEALSQCAHVIIQSLFTRDEDSPYRDAFNAVIDELATSENEESRNKILRVLREIKANRMARAGAFLDQKAKGDERRHAEDNPTAPLEGLSDEGLGDKGLGDKGPSAD